MFFFHNTICKCYKVILVSRPVSTLGSRERSGYKNVQRFDTKFLLIHILSTFDSAPNKHLPLQSHTQGFIFYDQYAYKACNSGYIYCTAP